VSVVCWSGDIEEGEALIAPLRAQDVEADFVGPVGYADFNCSIDDPPGFRNWWTAEHLDAMSDEVIEIVAEHAMRQPTGPTQTFLVPWGGAVARQGGDWPLARRDAAWVVHPFALWEGAGRDAEHIAWARGMASAVRPHANGGVYLNFTGDEGAERIRAAFGDENLERLRAVKERYDPHNVFRLNHNIAPVRPAPVPA
jgi:FAD/FMN-containing dehydrogenase